MAASSSTSNAFRQNEGQAPPCRPRRAAAANACMTPCSPPSPNTEAGGNFSSPGGRMAARTVSASSNTMKPGLVQQKKNQQLAYCESSILELVQPHGRQVKHTTPCFANAIGEQWRGIQSADRSLQPAACRVVRTLLLHNRKTSLQTANRSGPHQL